MALQLVPSGGPQHQLLRTPSFSFNLPEKMEDLFNNLPEATLNNSDPGDRHVQQMAEDQINGQHIVGKLRFKLRTLSSQKHKQQLEFVLENVFAQILLRLKYWGWLKYFTN